MQYFYPVVLKKVLRLNELSVLSAFVKSSHLQIVSKKLHGDKQESNRNDDIKYSAVKQLFSLSIMKWFQISYKQLYRRQKCCYSDLVSLELIQFINYEMILNQL